MNDDDLPPYWECSICLFSVASWSIDLLRAISERHIEGHTDDLVADIEVHLWKGRQ